MIEIHTNVGDLYLEERPTKQDPQFINLFDSNEKHLYRFETEKVLENQTIEEYVCKILEKLITVKTVEELLEYLNIYSYTTGESWIDLLEDMYGFDGYDYDFDNDKYVLLSDGSEITEQRVMENYNVNKIGATYVLDCA